MPWNFFFQRIRKYSVFHSCNITCKLKVPLEALFIEKYIFFCTSIIHSTNSSCLTFVGKFGGDDPISKFKELNLPSANLSLNVDIQGLLPIIIKTLEGWKLGFFLITSLRTFFSKLCLSFKVLLRNSLEHF